MQCPACKAENEPTAEACFTCGAPLATVSTRGALVASRYEIVGMLGKGGMGAVYKAHDRVLDEVVAPWCPSCGGRWPRSPATVRRLLSRRPRLRCPWSSRRLTTEGVRRK